MHLHLISTLVASFKPNNYRSMEYKMEHPHRLDVQAMQIFITVRMSDPHHTHHATAIYWPDE